MRITSLLATLVIILSIAGFPVFAEDISVTRTVTVGNNDSSLVGSTFNRTSTTNTLGKSITSSAYSFQLFSDISIPQGATITSAQLLLGVANSGGNTIHVSIAAEDVSNATAPTNTATFNAKKSAITSASVNWSNVPKLGWGGILTSPDISSVIQEIVDRSDWQSGNSINIYIGDNGSNNYSQTSYFTANFTGAGQKPQLTITYSLPSTTPTPTPLPTATPTVAPTNTPTNTPTPTNIPTPTATSLPTATPTVTPLPSATPTVAPTNTPTSTPLPTATPTIVPTIIPGGTTTTVTRAVTSSAEDSSVSGTSFSSTSTTQPLGKNMTTSTRNILTFSNLSIPKGAQISSANLSFELSGSGGNNVHVIVAATNTGSAGNPSTVAQFQNAEQNKTTQQVLWNNVTKGGWGTQISSPQITSVVQELVNREDWQVSSPVQLIISDNNSDAYSHATFFTYDFSGAGQKPTLTVTYVLNGNQITPTPLPTATPTVIPTTSPTPSTTPLPTATPTVSPTAVPTATPTILLSPSVSPTVTPTPVPGTTVVTVPINYGDVSRVYYRDLTLVAQIGLVSDVAVKVNGQDIPYTYSPSTGELVFTTSASTVELHLQNVNNPQLIQVTKAALKNNKKWAWSLGFDDNVNLKPSVTVLEQKGWRGTFYLIARDVDQTRDESWIVDKPYLTEKLNNGWAIGNHTFDHNCGSPNAQSITQAYTVLRDIVVDSQKPDYRLISFAAPCFASQYNNLISTMRTNGTNEVLFNETQGSGLMIVTPGTGNYTSGSYTADSVSSTTVSIGRDGEIDWAPANVIQRMNWMSAQASQNRHFWLNTFLHGEKEANLQNVAQHAYTAYGPGGSNEMWMAPADEVYSYMYIRDNASIGTLTVSTGQ